MAYQIAKTVFGIYVLEDPGSSSTDVIAKEPFDEDTAAEQLLTEHPLEQEYADAEHVVLPRERLAELAGVEPETVRERQVKVAREITNQQIREAGDRDQLLVQAVRALDDLNEMNNDTSERLRPWYAIHFPELEEQVSSNEEFAATVAAEAHRDKLTDYEDMAAESTGIDIDETDAKMLRLYATQLENAYQLREELEQYVELLAREVAPNLDAVLGSLLAARIISLAGSLEKMAKMPASTIQVLGAEKAMFRHMKGEGKAPKHGVLFQHEYVQQVPGDKRGDMARFIANKTAIAARIDQYGGDFKGESLRAEVTERFEELA